MVAFLIPPSPMHVNHFIVYIFRRGGGGGGFVRSACCSEKQCVTLPHSSMLPLLHVTYFSQLFCHIILLHVGPWAVGITGEL